MELIIDLHTHSKYARGCSPQMGIAPLARTARSKGIGLVGTGDFTHPKFFEEIKAETRELEAGGKNALPLLAREGTLFVPTVEINNTFEDAGGKRRRIHTLIVQPDLSAAAQFGESIAPRSRLGTDGRPWVRASLSETVDWALAAHPKALVIPAHAWTPWYGIFGAKGGYDSLKDAFGDRADKVFAIETGLSSDPPMNWRCSWLDSVRLVSFSDAHSPDKLGREATVLELERLDFASIHAALSARPPAAPAGARPPSPAPNRIARTIEFFPQEGKYYADGHRECGVCLRPEQTRAAQGRCPRCGKKLTVGVLNRIESLADRPEGFRPPGAPGFVSIVPLRELVAMALGQGPATLKVARAYDALVEMGGSEFAVLQMPPAQLEARWAASDASIARLPPAHMRPILSALTRMQAGTLSIQPGFDGQFGVVGL